MLDISSIMLSDDPQCRSYAWLEVLTEVKNAECEMQNLWNGRCAKSTIVGHNSKGSPNEEVSAHCQKCGVSDTDGPFSRLAIIKDHRLVCHTFNMETNVATYGMVYRFSLVISASSIEYVQ